MKINLKTISAIAITIALPQTFASETPSIESNSVLHIPKKSEIITNGDLIIKAKEVHINGTIHAKNLTIEVDNLFSNGKITGDASIINVRGNIDVSQNNQ